MSLKGKRVAVTGATGFVGGCLARRLIDGGAEVVLAGRNVSHRAEELVALGGIPVDFDLTTPETFTPVLDGVDVLFHVAAWVDKTSARLAEPLNVTAVGEIVRAAHLASVRRVVHVSTVAVYDLTAHTVYTEDLAPDTDQPDLYGATKARGEALGLATAASLDVEFVAIRPAMVYGPGADGWTRDMFRLVHSGTPCIFGRGDGLCYPLYIDNLVDGLVAAATAADVDGECIHLADDPVTWRAWFEYYGRMSGRAPRALPLPVANLLGLACEKLPLGLPLSRFRVAITQNPLEFDTAKATRLLGWSSKVTLDDGMKRSEQWLHEIGAVT